jgi:hypothetical protein
MSIYKLDSFPSWGRNKIKSLMGLSNNDIMTLGGILEDILMTGKECSSKKAWRLGEGIKNYVTTFMNDPL